MGKKTGEAIRHWQRHREEKESAGIDALTVGTALHTIYRKQTFSSLRDVITFGVWAAAIDRAVVSLQKWCDVPRLRYIRHGFEYTTRVDLTKPFMFLRIFMTVGLYWLLLHPNKIDPEEKGEEKESSDSNSPLLGLKSEAVRVSGEGGVPSRFNGYCDYHELEAKRPLKRAARKTRTANKYAELYDGDEIQVHARDRMDKHDINADWRAQAREYASRLDSDEYGGIMGDHEDVTVYIKRADGRSEQYLMNPNQYYEWMCGIEKDYDDRYESAMESLPGGTEENRRRCAEENLAMLRGLQIPKKESFMGTATIDFKKVAILPVSGSGGELCAPLIGGKLYVLQHAFGGDDVVEVKVGETKTQMKRAEAEHTVKHRDETLLIYPAPQGMKSTAYKVSSVEPHRGDQVVLVGCDPEGNIRSSSGFMNQTDHSHNATTKSGWCGSLVLCTEGQTPRILGIHCWGGTDSNSYFPLEKKKPPDDKGKG